MKSSLRQLGAVAAVAVALAATAHASAPAGRYTYTATSLTVVDTKTRLTWQRGFGATMSLANAKTYCASTSTSTTLGGAGWRVPTIKELQSLVDYSQATAPMIDQTAFPGTPLSYFWSSSPGAGDPVFVTWVVSFAAGVTTGIDPSDPANLRCVR